MSVNSAESVLQALEQAAAAQRIAYDRAVGTEALTIHQALLETLQLRDQIKQRHGHDLKAILGREAFRVSPMVPAWLPEAIARQFGSAMTTRQAIMESASRNVTMPSAPMMYPKLKLEERPANVIDKAAGRLRRIFHGTDESSEKGSGKSNAVSEKRLELLRAKEERLQAELEALEAQEIEEQDLHGFEEEVVPQRLDFSPPAGGASSSSASGMLGNKNATGARIDDIDFSHIFNAEGQSQTTGSWIRIPPAESAMPEIPECT